MPLAPSSRTSSSLRRLQVRFQICLTPVRFTVSVRISFVLLIWNSRKCTGFDDDLLKLPLLENKIMWRRLIVIRMKALGCDTRITFRTEGNLKSQPRREKPSGCSYLVPCLHYFLSIMCTVNLYYTVKGDCR